MTPAASPPGAKWEVGMMKSPANLFILAGLAMAAVILLAGGPSASGGGAAGAGAPKTEKIMEIPENAREIHFAGGCFWGVEEFFSRVPGVCDAVSGYANGTTENPTYRQVCSGTTGHAETVRVRYDPAKVGLRRLAELFFRIIDPTSRNRQGNDVGTQYRTGIYYSDAADRPVLEAVMEDVRKRHSRPLAVELEPLRSFFPAEDYHQDYLRKNPGGYCHIDFAAFGDGLDRAE